MTDTQPLHRLAKTIRSKNAGANHFTAIDTLPDPASPMVARLKELAGEAATEERIVQEAAAMAVKADVREELDRLAGHVDAARGLLFPSETDAPVEAFAWPAGPLSAAGVLAQTGAAAGTKVEEVTLTDFLRGVPSASRGRPFSMTSFSAATISAIRSRNHMS